jgi:hypothetical protein
MFSCLVQNACSIHWAPLSYCERQNLKRTHYRTHGMCVTPTAHLSLTMLCCIITNLLFLALGEELLQNVSFIYY